MTSAPHTGAEIGRPPSEAPAPDRTEELIELVVRAIAIVATDHGLDATAATLALGRTLLEAAEDSENGPQTVH